MDSIGWIRLAELNWMVLIGEVSGIAELGLAEKQSRQFFSEPIASIIKQTDVKKIWSEQTISRILFQVSGCP
jgi:hypothetical protein